MQPSKKSLNLLDQKVIKPSFIELEVLASTIANVLSIYWRNFATAKQPAIVTHNRSRLELFQPICFINSQPSSFSQYTRMLTHYPLKGLHHTVPPSYWNYLKQCFQAHQSIPPLQLTIYVLEQLNFTLILIKLFQSMFMMK